MIHLSPPEAFAPKFEVVSCYVQHDGKFLLLLRNDDKSEGNKWGTPGGKVDQGEAKASAIAREVAEETGVDLPPEQYVFFRTNYVRYPDYDFIFHEYSVDLDALPTLNVRPTEHKAAAWATPQEALGMALVLGNDQLVRTFYGL